jgi:hypothetical protein
MDAFVALASAMRESEGAAAADLRLVLLGPARDAGSLALAARLPAPDPARLPDGR